MSNWPVSLKPISKYMARAREMDNKDNVVAYYCRFYSLQRAIELRDKNDEQATQFVTGLLEKCETLKQALDMDVQAHQQHLHTFSMSVFDNADQEDRAGLASRQTALTFYAAMCFMEVCNVFGELPSAMIEKLRYAKWKAADITKALREGRKPLPGAPGEEQQPPPQPQQTNNNEIEFPSLQLPIPDKEDLNKEQQQTKEGEQSSMLYPTFAPAYPSSDQPSPLQERAKPETGLYPESENNPPPRMPTLPTLQIPGQAVSNNVQAIMPTPQLNGKIPQKDYQTQDRGIGEGLEHIPPTDRPLPPYSNVTIDQPLVQPPVSGYGMPSSNMYEENSGTGGEYSAPMGYPKNNGAGMGMISMPPPAHPPTMMTPATLPMSMTKPYDANYEPSVKQTQEAQRLAKYAASALDFQDLKSAIANLEQALGLLRGTQ